MAVIEDGVEQEVTPPEPKPPKGGKDETVTLTKAEHAALLRERDELRVSERSWADIARHGRKEAPPELEEEPIETDGLVPEVTGNEDVDAAIFEDPEKWTEALTKGPKAIGAYIKSLGLVNGAQVAEIAVKAARGVVDARVQAMQTDNQLVGDFAEMRDPKSDLFKAAAPIYQKLVAMNGGKQTTALLYAAAGQAKAELAAKAPKPKPRTDDDEYNRYEPEDDRRARARAQGSDRGRPAPVQDDDAADLGPEALAICKAMDIKPEDFIASQKQLGRRRR